MRYTKLQLIIFCSRYLTQYWGYHRVRRTRTYAKTERLRDLKVTRFISIDEALELTPEALYYVLLNNDKEMHNMLDKEMTCRY